MANDCLPQVHACRLRVGRLNSDGSPDQGANNLYVSNALSVLTITPVYEDGSVIREKNACDEVLVDYEGDDSLLRGDFSLTLLVPDPELTEMLTEGTVLISGSRRGYAVPPVGLIDGYGVSIEAWQKRIEDGDLADTDPYAWHVLPKAKKLRLGETTLNNGNRATVITGKLYENPNWNDGPANDWPIASDRFHQWLPWSSIPAAQCGYQTLAAS